MKIVKPSATVASKFDTDCLSLLESFGRVCYQSYDAINANSAEDFIRKIIARGHESVLEHFSFTVEFTCDRGISHEIVRHRLAAYSQESTRYCNYSNGKFNKEITVVKPYFLSKKPALYNNWLISCQTAEREYFNMLVASATAQEARSVLPTCLKTNLVMTANIREWRHFFRLRTDKAAHPDMRVIAVPLLAECKKRVPVLFEDIPIDEQELQNFLAWQAEDTKYSSVLSISQNASSKADDFHKIIKYIRENSSDTDTPSLNSFLQEGYKNEEAQHSCTGTFVNQLRALMVSFCINWDIEPDTYEYDIPFFIPIVNVMKECGLDVCTESFDLYVGSLLS